MQSLLDRSFLQVDRNDYDDKMSDIESILGLYLSQAMYGPVFVKIHDPLSFRYFVFLVM